MIGVREVDADCNRGVVADCNKGLVQIATRGCCRLQHIEQIYRTDI